jgi:hypothetical protein
VKYLKWLIPVLGFLIGVYFGFYEFWNGFDAISGDLGDARFNAFVLEHTWLWLKGIHPSLFDMPIYYPTQNAYSYSDYLFGTAPLYWFMRQIGLEMLLSYQGWLIGCASLNFVSFFVLARRYFQASFAFATLGAFVFAFSLPRMTHLEHGQLVPQFYVLVSLMGVLEWRKSSGSRLAPWLFFGGASLQLISGFYFLWFWVWTLAVLLVYLISQSVQRSRLIEGFKGVSVKHVLLSAGLFGGMILPFLYHYILAGGDFSRHDWVTISNSVPRLYSWISLPRDHWQWQFLPARSWIEQLSVPHEHYLSFGLMTWMGMLLATKWMFRQKKDVKLWSIPLIAMFFFTLTSGRFSTWVFVSYLFPGGGVIRAVSRIQIFMLMFWSIAWVLYLEYLWNSRSTVLRSMMGLLVIAFFSENIYLSNWVFSRSAESARIQKRAKDLPADCEVLANPLAFDTRADFLNIDMVMLAFQTGRATMNGYSGRSPKGYGEAMKRIPEVSESKKVCVIGGAQNVER